MISKKLALLLGTIAIGATIVSYVHAKKSRSSLIGTQAPDFIISNATGKPQKLSDLKGKKIALCFYPRDNSPFCTKQLCSVRNGIHDLEKKNILIIGISTDSAEKHAQFKKEQSLPFLLVSDPDKKIARMYKATGGLFGLLKRMTVLIDETGTIVNVINNVSITDHAQQIMNGFNTTKKR
jgi:peroxiredoxin Q/BCP